MSRATLNNLLRRTPLKILLDDLSDEELVVILEEKFFEGGFGEYVLDILFEEVKAQMPISSRNILDKTYTEEEQRTFLLAFKELSAQI